MNKNTLIGIVVVVVLVVVAVALKHSDRVRRLPRKKRQSDCFRYTRMLMEMNKFCYEVMCAAAAHDCPDSQFGTAPVAEKLLSNHYWVPYR